MSLLPKRLVFGGSFDPIHHGHLFIAEFAAHHIGADQVIFMPTRRAPHRAPLSASVADRLAMLRMAIAPNLRFSIDTSDLEENASGYTADVLPKIQQRNSDARLSFLVGEDAVTRSRWHRFDDVVASVERFLIAPRDTTDAVGSQPLLQLFESLQPSTRERLELLPSPRITISATAIRDRIHAAATIRYLVPESVRRYIEEHKLYIEKGAACHS